MLGRCRGLGMSSDSFFKRNKALVLSAGGLLLVAVVFLVWYLVASGAFRRLRSEFDRQASVTETARDKILDAGGAPKAEIHFGEVTSFLEAFKSGKPGLEAAAKRMQDGEGLAFWLGTARRTEFERMSARIKVLEDLAAEAQKAVTDVGPIHADAAAALKELTESRLSSAGALGPTSDSKEFQSQIDALRALKERADQNGERIVAATGSNPLGGTAGGIRRSILSGLDRRVRTEGAAIDAWTGGFESAKANLDTYKAEISGIINSNTGLLAGADDLARRIYPLVSRASESTRPLIAAIDRLDQPAFGIGPSVLQTAGFVLPGLNQAVGTIRSFCQGIETARVEAHGLMQNTEPFLAAVGGFSQDPGRDRIQEVVAASEQAASYCQSKVNVFDPVFDKIGEVRGWVSKFNDIAGRFGPLGEVANFAYGVIDRVEQPFSNARTTISNVAGSLSRIRPMEEEYVAGLNRIASGLPGFPGGGTVRASGGPAAMDEAERRTLVDLLPLFASAEASMGRLNIFRAKRQFNEVISRSPDAELVGRARSKIRTINLITYGGGGLLLLLVLGIPAVIWSRKPDGTTPPEVTYTGPTGPAPIVSHMTAGGPALRFLSGEFKGTTIPLAAGQRVIIGRDPQHANIILSHPQVSRAHILVRWDPLVKTFLVQDLNAMHGNFVNGRRLTQGEKVLTDGTNVHVEMGSHIASFILINTN